MTQDSGSRRVVSGLKEHFEEILRAEAEANAADPATRDIDSMGALRYFRKELKGAKTVLQVLAAVQASSSITLQDAMKVLFAYLGLEDGWRNKISVVVPSDDGEPVEAELNYYEALFGLGIDNWLFLHDEDEDDEDDEDDEEDEEIDIEDIRTHIQELEEALAEARAELRDAESEDWKNE